MGRLHFTRECGSRVLPQSSEVECGTGCKISIRNEHYGLIWLCRLNKARRCGGRAANPIRLRRSIMLDAQDGQVMPVSVRDVGEEVLTINASVIRARRYTVISRYSQDVWYNDQSRLVQARLVARDGSVITYRLL